MRTGLEGGGGGGGAADLRPGRGGGPPPVDWLYEGGGGAWVVWSSRWRLLSLLFRLLETGARGAGAPPWMLDSVGRRVLMLSKASSVRIPFSRRDSSSWRGG